MKMRFLSGPLAIATTFLASSALAGIQPKYSSSRLNGIEAVEAEVDALIDAKAKANRIESKVDALIHDASQSASKQLPQVNTDTNPLSYPKYTLIPAEDINQYKGAERYLLDSIGNSEVSHFLMLREDYKFRNPDGSLETIPAGFIWDGASIPKATWAVLAPGNTRYNSAIPEGLIHDYMYRNPQRYSKEEADLLFLENLKRCGNPDPLLMYEGVVLKGKDSYQSHLRNQIQGLYDELTPESYRKNLDIYNELEIAKREASKKAEEFLTGKNVDAQSDSKECKPKDNDAPQVCEEQKEEKGEEEVVSEKVEIDLSADIAKMIELLKKRIKISQSLLSRGTRATEEEIASTNAIIDESLQVLIVLNNKIDALDISDEGKDNIAKDALKPLLPYIEQIQWLDEELERQKILEIKHRSLSEILNRSSR